jgi:hypothetical protein
MNGRIHLAPTGRRESLKHYLTMDDIKREKVRLEDGLVLQFRCEDIDEAGIPDDLYFEGTVHRDSDGDGWYVLINEATYCNESDV